MILLGVILVSGYFFGLVAEKFSFPRVSAYLFAGILFSQELLGQVFHLQTEKWSDLFTKICLGFIAYIVGGEINIKKLRGQSWLLIRSTLLSSIFPVVFVYFAILLLCRLYHLDPVVAIILASVASTTDPAATLAVIEQYKSKGKVTDTSLAIVALDDPLGVLIFVFISTFFLPNLNEGVIHLISREIFASIILGSIFGFSLSKFAKLSLSDDYFLPLLTGLVLLSVGISEYFHLSGLLACTFVGFVANNTNIKDCERVSLLLPVQHIKELIYIMFFTFAGTHFSIEYFYNAIVFIIFYLVARGLGKYLGAYLGSNLGIDKDEHTAKYLGLTLLPQAGVAIGLLIQIIQHPHIRPHKELIFNIILGSTIIYEVFGPILAKKAFRKAGEIQF